MPTDKETAAAMRVIAAWHIANNRPHLANMEDDRADELDPPTPALADGLYRWDYSDGYIVYITRKDGSWLDCNGKPDNEVHPQPDTKITRVRVLDDQHVAVPVVTLRTDMVRAATEDYTPGSPVGAVLNAYAEAVEDSEAGDRA